MVIDVQEGHSRQATESTFCPGLGTSGTSSPWLHSKAPQPHSQDPSETVPYPFPDYIPTLELVATGSSIDDFNPEPTPPNDSLVERPSNGFVNPVAPITPVSPAEFLTIVNSIREAIEQGINPVMIPKGSSGSYFCRNVRGEVVGVFKPKDEEPYGHLNPKCTKWIHRNLFPCCFGRDCLIPNLGYTSEAAAYYMDQRLGLGIVPATHIIKLASPAFSYPYQDRWSHTHRGKPLPPKMGSFQLFVKDFEDASRFFYRGYEMLKTTSVNDSREPLLNQNGGANTPSTLSRASSADWTDDSRRLFRFNFERMVVLDYLIRQTDRGMDNWMIKKTEVATTNSPDGHDPCLALAAIDNGLAFPFKHPDSIRSYPYGWSFLPIARIQFSPETGYQTLCYLTSQEWWDETVRGLHAIFSLDRDFSEQMFAKQISVVRGQSVNLIETLRRTGTPAELVSRPLVTVVEEVEKEDGVVAQTKRSLLKVKKRIQTMSRSQPWFSSC